MAGTFLPLAKPAGNHSFRHAITPQHRKDCPWMSEQTLPPQSQTHQPGTEAEMEPRPQSEMRDYRAAGKTPRMSRRRA
jgi:hypothetical protein